MEKTVPRNVTPYSQQKGALAQHTCVCKAVNSTALKQRMIVKIIIIVTLY